MVAISMRTGSFMAAAVLGSMCSGSFFFVAITVFSPMSSGGGGLVGVTVLNRWVGSPMLGSLQGERPTQYD